jgi:hypothetical protein
MNNNFLEELIAEWYQYRGYFIRQNVLVGKRQRGGWECELDIVAFLPTKGHLVHIEPSMDASSWAKREERYKKKFDAGKRHIHGLFQGMSIPTEIEQIAVFGIVGSVKKREIGGGTIVTLDELVADICTSLLPRKMLSEAVPEHYPLLRTFQLLNDHRKAVTRVWDSIRKPSSPE